MGLFSVQAQAVAVAPPPLSTFNFTGNCVDCAQFQESPSYAVTARLILKNYFQGTPIFAANFVSFSYGGSNLLSAYSILATDPLFVSGNIPSALPNAADFHVRSSLHFFDLSPSGIWNTGNSIPMDNGNVGSFSPNAPSSVPEPATMLLMGAALAAAGLTRRRLRKS